ncbi:MULTISPECIES: malto-oligosyltrehalose synthase [unclassified Curtobacterium]|uniref:malto-oligosyltrehalose synthase n=1 Tax=unclassified Curtobacterium TaxID=257496 RepID=UPI0008DDDE4D|nr:MULTISPECIES: malto-oligosyltrehalose synthase [unclassified Curtobacterium]OIH96879.1 malto-oligosyltrehalose synthase [Curtobacterium sp. MCBA15_003]OII09377.1 malto-oligosyltrehalose synthase [Curtobacterium sp. MCBA15_009]OII31067.1 malto-oligosyltrehalose synthase [Curtobacterium sp. MMLR14_006]
MTADATGAARRVPVSTYRLQVSADFDLTAARDVVDYVRDLGADWIYLSPVLQAESGSNHGYDVVDHTRVDDERGGDDALRAVAEAAHTAGLGVLVDVVPNHVGVATPESNPWWWSLLELGQGSPVAWAFDVDWDAGDGKVRVPVLDDRLLKAVTLDTTDPARPVLRVGETAYPTAPGTVHDGDTVDAVHERQHYAFVHWKRADHDLNYRRFFAVNTLAAIRVEEPEVFAASHGVIGGWFRDGLVDGLRIDHPDGLFDPAGYLQDLAELTGGAYTLVEKILEPGEQLPSSWPVDGTTGYDALGVFDRVFVDPAGETDLTAASGAEPADWQQLTHDTRRGIADGILGSEVERLARLLAPTVAGSDAITHERVVDAVAELVASFDVYRTYLPEGAHHLITALERAAEARPDLDDVIDRIAPALVDPMNAAALRLQQTSGMVMAKGVEDTAFYRTSRLSSLSEVGSDPSVFAVPVDAFHQAQRERLGSWPNTMTTLTTHDTKRSEDTRARIAVLAELGAEWSATLERLQSLVPLEDRVFADLLWQAIVGARPASRERLHAYAEKASREAGDSTTWTEPDEAFESQMHAIVDAAFDDPAVVAVLDALDERIDQAGWSNGLGQKLVQLTAPGVPDVYQGTEFWDRSLVDPDNRRPVDYTERRHTLAAVDGPDDDGPQRLPDVGLDGAVKLLVTTRALRLRRDHQELFTRYLALEASGSAADHVLAFDRGGAVTVATRLPIGLERVGGWGDTLVHPVPLERVDVLTGRRFPASRGIALSELLATYPVALLVPAETVVDPDHVDAATAAPETSRASRPATAATTDAPETDAQAEIDILEGHA